MRDVTFYVVSVGTLSRMNARHSTHTHSDVWHLTKTHSVLCRNVIFFGPV